MKKATVSDALLDSLEPINTKEKVDKLFNAINPNKSLSNVADLKISMRIRKLSIQQYYQKKKKDREKELPVRLFFSKCKNDQIIYSVKYILEHLRPHLYTSDQKCTICGHPFHLGRTYIKDKLCVAICSDCMALFRKTPMCISEFRLHNKEQKKHDKTALNKITKTKYKKSQKQEKESITNHEAKEEVKVFHSQTSLLNGIFQISWNEVLFRDGFYLLRITNSSESESSLLRVEDDHSRYAFNEIKCLFEKKLSILQVEIKEGIIIKIHNKPRLDALISIMEYKVSQSLVNKTNSLISISKERKELSSKTAKAYCKQFKSRYIDYLCAKQLDDYNVVCCIEYRINSNHIFAKEHSFIFTIKEVSDLIYLAYENTSDLRCTYLFPIPKGTWKNSIDMLYEFFASNEVNKRQQMASHLVDLCLPGNYAYLRVYHANYMNWVDKIKHCR